MRYFSVNGGQYPYYNNIHLTVYKNQNTLILFDWNSLFRSWNFIPDLNNFKFRLMMTLDSKIGMEENAYAILSSDGESISVDEDSGLIMCRLGIHKTKDLRIYDSGKYSFDCASIDEQDMNFMNQFANNYYRLCCGRWSVDDHAMILDKPDYNQISSYVNYNVLGSDEIITSFTYEEV